MDRIKKGDTAVLIAGKDKKKKGEVIQVNPKDNTVVIKGLNLMKKSVKKNDKNPAGGYHEIEAAVDLSNVMPFCPKCGKGVRVGTIIAKDGSKTRVCKKCNHKFE